MTQCAHIADFQLDGRAFCRRINQFGHPFVFSSFEVRFGFFKLRLACISDGTVDPAGQRWRFGHQCARTRQCAGRRIHVALLQAYLATAQVGLCQTSLKGLQADVASIGGL
ncbi:hypothetical protein ALP29_200880 [Pseudomonas syringae pv. avii]|uniref:Uncharacterized protein n=1 Tax=Pseudomonas syringae pv. avii TaxID=663959 RepID=A0A3M5VUC8_PSESX|nr:hypothetical protein ALP29_200880 [Pseudomonas syringae pv. avii]